MSKNSMARRSAIVILTLGVSACFSTTMRRVPDESPQPVESRQITDNTLSLREHWRIFQNCIGNSYDSPPLAAISNRVICIHDDSVAVNQLHVFDATNGSLLWEAKGRPGSGDLAVDAERVYFLNQFELYAYDLNDGQRLWGEQKVLPHRNYYLHSDGDKLYARVVAYSTVYYFDARTGDKLGSDSLPTDDRYRWLARLPQFDLYTGRTTLKAVDVATQKTLWVTNIGNIGPAVRLPILVDHGLLVGVGELVLAIDVQTGQIKWRNWNPPDQERPFASNFVVIDGSLYALDYHARLLQLDIETGRETGYIQFTPDDINLSQKRYTIAADGQMLFVSFGDSQELIALGP